MAGNHQPRHPRHLTARGAEDIGADAGDEALQLQLAPGPGAQTAGHAGVVGLLVEACGAAPRLLACWGDRQGMKHGMTPRQTSPCGFL